MMGLVLSGALAGHVLRLGPMRFTVYGAAAATGVVAAMGLSGRAAKHVGVSADAAWDAGLLAILSCFLASRLLLVLRDPVAFVHFPLLLLGLPSLTFGGMALAAAVVWLSLRRKGVPLLPMLDAFAPGGAALAAFLELGHWLDGSEPGMPTMRAGEVLTLRPAAAYGVVGSLLLAGLLWWALRLRPGCATALGLFLGGLMAFGLDMISLPSTLFAGWWLEPGQIVALLAILAGGLAWVLGTAHDKSPKRSDTAV